MSKSTNLPALVLAAERASRSGGLDAATRTALADLAESIAAGATAAQAKRAASALIDGRLRTLVAQLAAARNPAAKGKATSALIALHGLAEAVDPTAPAATPEPELESVAPEVDPEPEPVYALASTDTTAERGW